MGNTIAYDFVLDNNCQHGKRVAMRGKKQKTENREIWRVSMPGDLAEKAKILAKAETRTISNILRHALKQYLEKEPTA